MPDQATNEGRISPPRVSIPVARGSAPEAAGPVETMRGLVAVTVALLMLLGFAVLVYFLVGQADRATESTWSRLVYLFGAAEALVFTAVGWLFGREVNRQAAATAEVRADEASVRAEDATNAAGQQEAKGRALKAAVDARARQADRTKKAVEERGVGSGNAPSAGPGVVEIQDLADFARLLYPEK